MSGARRAGEGVEGPDPVGGGVDPERGPTAVTDRPGDRPEASAEAARDLCARIARVRSTIRELRSEGWSFPAGGAGGGGAPGGVSRSAPGAGRAPPPWPDPGAQRAVDA